MAKKEDLLIRAQALVIPGELKHKLELLINRCPDHQLGALETAVENFEVKQKAKLEEGIRKSPEDAKTILRKFDKDSRELVSNHVGNEESQQAEEDLNKELNEL